MVKTSFKTFVCSFFLSLFVLAAANRLFFDASHISSAEEIKIPTKNISLFVKDSAVSPVLHTVSVSEKDLSALNVFPQEAAGNNDVLSSESQADTVVFSESTENSLSDEDIIPSQNVFLSPTGEISEDGDFSLENSALPKKENKNPEATVSKASFDDIPPVISETNVQISKDEEQPDTVVLAEIEEENLFIPLQHDGKLPVYASNKITIDGEQAKRQLAMKDASLPLKPVPFPAAEGSGEPAPKPSRDNSLPANWKIISDIRTQPSSFGHFYEAQKVDVPEILQEETKQAKEPDAAKKETSGKSTTEDKTSTHLSSAGNEAKPENFSEDLLQEKETTRTLSEKISSIPQEKQTKVAGEVVKNILIPIPEEIIKDKNLTPQLTSDPKDKALEKELEQEENLSGDVKNESSVFLPTHPPFSSQTDEKEEGGFFKSLTSIFSGSKGSTGRPVDEADKKTVSESEKNDFGLPELKGKILPTEMRLTFQANRAAISGKTLKWVQAFGEKAKNSEDIIIEIRIDGATSYTLQQKRLNLLYNILTNLGLDYNKIKTVFTVRDANSFILRTVKMRENNEKAIDPAAMYYL